MEGLSAAANIISILQAANAVLNLCYDFKAALNTVPWALTRAFEEVTSLRDTLEAVEKLCSSRDDGKNAARSPFQAQQLDSDVCKGALATCLSALEELEVLLGPKATPDAKFRRWQALRQSVSWRFKDQEVMEILERLQRCKSTLSLAMAAEEW